eukprot:g57358.t1
MKGNLFALLGDDSDDATSDGGEEDDIADISSAVAPVVRAATSRGQNNNNNKKKNKNNNNKNESNVSQSHKSSSSSKKKKDKRKNKESASQKKHQEEEEEEEEGCEADNTEQLADAIHTALRDGSCNPLLPLNVVELICAFHHRSGRTPEKNGHPPATVPPQDDFVAVTRKTRRTKREEDRQRWQEEDRAFQKLQEERFHAAVLDEDWDGYEGGSGGGAVKTQFGSNKGKALGFKESRKREYRMEKRDVQRQGQPRSRTAASQSCSSACTTLPSSSTSRQTSLSTSFSPPPTTLPPSSPPPVPPAVTRSFSTMRQAAEGARTESVHLSKRSLRIKDQHQHSIEHLPAAQAPEHRRTE